MEVQNLSTAKTVVTFSDEEKEQLRLALERLSQTFQLQISPVIKQLAEALRKATPAIQKLSVELDRAREICQRLDPAFSGPEEQPQPVRRLDPVTGQSLLIEDDPELGGVRPSPFPSPPRDGRGFIQPGPGTKADWDESRGEDS